MWIFIGVVLYFLSVGPAARLLYRSSSSSTSRRVFEALYAPVGWLQPFPIVRFYVYRYLNFCGAIDD